jgi:hypothetical protein
MIEVKQKLFQALRNDPTMKALLGISNGEWQDYRQGITPAAEIRYALTNSFADVFLRNAGGSGNVQSPVQSVNLLQYPTLEIVMTNMTAPSVVIGLVDTATSTYYQCARVIAPGAYTYDIPTVTGQSGTQSYRVRITVEGANGDKATFDSVKIYGVGGTLWLEDFQGGIPGEEPTGIADGHIVWNYMPENPIFPMIVFWESSSKVDVRFKGVQTITDLFYDLEIWDEAPDSTTIEQVKDRIMQLFQDTHEGFSDTVVNFYVSEVVDGGGDAFTVFNNRWYGKLRLHFKMQMVSDITKNI